MSELPCEICGTTQHICGHHIKSVGSGGDDVIENLISLCIYRCHRLIHDIPMRDFCLRNPKIINILLSKGWEFNDFTKKWVRYDND